jgi:hypothetical protein
MICRQPHEADGYEGSEKGADSVERLAQAEACAAQMGRGDIGDQGVARGAADAFTDAIDEACGDKPLHRSGQRKDWLGEGGETITQRCQQFAFAEPVAERA